MFEIKGFIGSNLMWNIIISYLVQKLLMFPSALLYLKLLTIKAKNY